MEIDEVVDVAGAGVVEPLEPLGHELPADSAIFRACTNQHEYYAVT